MPDFVSDIAFILVLVGVWVAQMALRRRTPKRRASEQQAPSAPIGETTDGRTESDGSTPGDRAGDRATRVRERRREGTVAPEEPTTRPETPPRGIAAIELSPRTMRQAVILSEILGKPKSLR